MSDSRSITLDEIDRQLIALLQINARESVATLARQLGIARTTVNSRLERLEKNKVISGYGVRLGQRVMGGGLQAYVGIKVQPRSGKEVVRRLSAMGQVQQLCAVSGEFDYVAWLRTDSPEQLDQLLDQIGSVDGVEKTTDVDHSQQQGGPRAAALNLAGGQASWPSSRPSRIAERLSAECCIDQTMSRLRSGA
ncbi:AsnC family transcriptional regulator [Pseudomonas putida S11]|nr:AsnC family transcriptional regulator [Pseudomonas putida S11]